MLSHLSALTFAGALLFGNSLANLHENKLVQRSNNHDRQRSNVVRSVTSPKLPDAGNASSFRYLTNKTEPYRVTSLPDVHFNIGEFYSGSVPIDLENPNRTLFFAFKPDLNGVSEDITIWLNGGPGCSSLTGFLQENGPWLWQPGTFLPVENPYTWANLSNVLWVEQPVGTGFSQGTVTATSEEDVAADFVNFFKNFEDIFGIKNYKIYVTGESFAGLYVPYISAAMLDKNDTTYFDLSGALTYDPVLSEADVNFEAAVVPFIDANNNLINFNQTFLDELNSLHQSCGYADFLDTYLTFPPAGIQPSDTNASFPQCDVFDIAYNATLAINPCFNIYSINQQCPLLWDVLSFPTGLFYSPPGSTTYFNRTDVKKAMHAPLDVVWSVCNNGVFANNTDTSAESIDHAIPQVIEATNRFLIANGDYDMILQTNQTLLAIQNMTWNGKLGFQQRPSTPINITIPDLEYAATYADPVNEAEGLDGAQGIMGIQHFERGLMWSQTFQSGHMEPEFQPRVTYRHLEWLLGRVETL